MQKSVQPCLCIISNKNQGKESKCRLTPNKLLQSLTTGGWRTCKLAVASHIRDHLSQCTLLTRANNCLIPSQSSPCSVLTTSRKDVLQSGTTSVIPGHLLHDLHHFADFSYTQFPHSLPSHFFPGCLESPLHLSGSPTSDCLLYIFTYITFFLK